MNKPKELTSETQKMSFYPTFFRGSTVYEMKIDKIRYDFIIYALAILYIHIIQNDLWDLARYNGTLTFNNIGEP